MFRSALGLTVFPATPPALAATMHSTSTTCAPVLGALAQARPDAVSLAHISARLEDAYGVVKSELSPAKRFNDEDLFAWADCAQEVQDTLFRFFENHEDALWKESRSGLDPVMAELQNFVGTVRGALQERSRKGRVADNPRMLEAMTTFALTWDIKTLCNTLADDSLPSTQKETLQALTFPGQLKRRSA